MVHFRRFLDGGHPAGEEPGLRRDRPQAGGLATGFPGRLTRGPGPGWPGHSKRSGARWSTWWRRWSRRSSSQAAFYESYGPEGVGALHATASHARGRGLVVLMDGKRNDIGSTAEAYARAYLGKVPVGDSFEPSWEVDALTVNPYLGTDGIVPFVKVAAREGKGIFVLVRTSNASAREFQDLVAEGRPLYRHVAGRLADWASPHRGESGYSLVGAVVGATYPAELAGLREALPGVPFLVPGYGTQGGTAADIAPAFDGQGLGALVNSSPGDRLRLQEARRRRPVRRRLAGRDRPGRPRHGR